MLLLSAEILLATLCQLLVAVQPSSQSLQQAGASSNNVPFKTSFVSTSDYSVRRSGALISLPLANVEQQQPDLLLMSAPSFEPSAEEQRLLVRGFRDESLAQQQQQHRPSFVNAADHQEVPVLTESGELTGGRQLEEKTNNEASPGADYSGGQLDDLLAAPSAEASQNSTGTSTAPPSTTEQQATTTTTLQPTTMTVASNVTTQAPNTLEVSTTSASTPTTAVPVVSTTESTTRAMIVTTTTEQQVVNATVAQTTTTTTTTAAAPTTTEQVATSRPTTTTTVATTTTTQAVPKTTLRPVTTTRQVVPVETTTTVAPVAPNRSSSGRSAGHQLCNYNEPNCGYVVATVPVLDKWPGANGTSNNTRVVNEFVFLPEDSSLNFEESGYSTRKQVAKGGPEADASSLKAEHRNIDTDGVSSEGDVELDYITSDADSLKTTTPTRTSPLSSVAGRVVTLATTPQPTTTTSRAPSSVVTQQQISTTSTARPTTAATTTTTTTTTTAPPPAKATTRVSYTVRMSESTTLAPAQTQATSTVAPSTTRRTAGVRANQKILRLSEPHPAKTTTSTTSTTTTTTTTTTKRPTRAADFGQPIRRKSKQVAAHRPFFDEPLGEQRRRQPGTNYSPTANGADEEEARILTRLSMPSQLSRLSAPTGLTAKAPQVVVPAKPVEQLVRRTSIQQTVNRRVSTSEPLAVNKATKAQLEARPALAKSQSATSEPTTQASARSAQQLTNLTAESVGAKKQQLVTAAPKLASRQQVVLLDFAEPISKREAEKRKPTGQQQEEVMMLIASSDDSGKAPEVAATFSPATIQTQSSTQVAPQVTSARVPIPEQVLKVFSSLHLTEAEPVKATTERPVVAPKSTTSQAPRLEFVRPARRPADQVDEYEGSVEDQLAKDALHSGPSATRRAAMTSNTYSSRARANTATWRQQSSTSASTSTTMDSGKWQPGPEDAAGNGDDSQPSNLLPGRPGVDYPIHWQVPKTSFDCRNYELSGFYVDVESGCQAYHSCHKGRGGRHTFLCPNGTLFSQELLTCAWWHQVECMVP